jgi:hypothetical protein
LEEILPTTGTNWEAEMKEDERLLLMPSCALCGKPVDCDQEEYSRDRDSNYWHSRCAQEERREDDVAVYWWLTSTRIAAKRCFAGLCFYLDDSGEHENLLSSCRCRVNTVNARPS